MEVITVTIKEEVRDLIFRGITYQVSNLGVIYKDGEKMRQNVNADDYLVVSVKGNRTIGVHRMVALAFVENDNPSIKKEVNHIDFDRQNNRSTNLEWLSHADNIRYSYENNRYPDCSGKNNSNYGNRKLSKFYKENPDIALEKQSRKGTQNGRCQKIEMYKEGSLINTFNYIGECAEHLIGKYGFGASVDSIRNQINVSIKKARPYKGFTFKKI